MLVWESSYEECALVIGNKVLEQVPQLRLKKLEESSVTWL